MSEKEQTKSQIYQSPWK